MRVHSDPILANVALLKHVLENNGIECEIRGAYLGGASGEIPPTEAWPELWVLDDAQVERARQLVRAAREASERSATDPSWTCPACREQVEGQFSACWSCGAERPSEG